MLSFWERESLTSADVIIIGGGLVGLSAACSIKEKQPWKSVWILERGLLPAGASTRNAGFACFSDITETLMDIELSSENLAMEIIRKRFQGLQKLRKRLPDELTGFRKTGGYEPIFNGDTHKVANDQLEYINALLESETGIRPFSFADHKIKDFGFNGVEQLILNSEEGMLNTGMLINSLWNYANHLGVRIITGAEVVEIDETGAGAELFVHHQVLKTNIPFRAEKVVLAANALIGEFMPELGIVPGRGQVVLTNEIPNLKFDGVFHFNQGFYYFRNIGQRVLMGGGRNLDEENESSSDFETNPLILESIDQYLRENILPGTSYEVEMHWQGIMGFTKNKLPRVEKAAENIVVAFSCNGMGVALSSSTGDEVADLVLS